MCTDGAADSVQAGYAADIPAARTGYTAAPSVARTIYAADTPAAMTAFAADTPVARTAYAADTLVAGTGYAADIPAARTAYAVDTSATGTVFTADAYKKTDNRLCHLDGYRRLTSSLIQRSSCNLMYFPSQKSVMRISPDAEIHSNPTLSYKLCGFPHRIRLNRTYFPIGTRRNRCLLHRSSKGMGLLQTISYLIPSGSLKNIA